MKRKLILFSFIALLHNQFANASDTKGDVWEVRTGPAPAKITFLNRSQMGQLCIPSVKKIKIDNWDSFLFNKKRNQAASLSDLAMLVGDAKYIEKQLDVLNDEIIALEADISESKEKHHKLFATKNSLLKNIKKNEEILSLFEKGKNKKKIEDSNSELNAEIARLTEELSKKEEELSGIEKKLNVFITFYKQKKEEYDHLADINEPLYEITRIIYENAKTSPQQMLKPSHNLMVFENFEEASKSFGTYSAVRTLLLAPIQGNIGMDRAIREVANNPNATKMIYRQKSTDPAQIAIAESKQKIRRGRVVSAPPMETRIRFLADINTLFLEEGLSGSFLNIITSKTVSGKYIPKIDPLTQFWLYLAEDVYKQIEPEIRSGKKWSFAAFEQKCNMELISRYGKSSEDHKMLEKMINDTVGKAKALQEQREKLQTTIDNLNTLILKKQSIVQKNSIQLAQIAQNEKEYDQDTVSQQLDRDRQELARVSTDLNAEISKLGKKNSILHQKNSESRRLMQELNSGEKTQKVMAVLALHSSCPEIKRADAYMRISALIDNYFHESLEEKKSSTTDIASEKAINLLYEQVNSKIMAKIFSDAFATTWAQAVKGLNDTSAYKDWLENSLPSIDSALACLSIADSGSQNIFVKRLLVDEPTDSPQFQYIRSAQATFYGHVAKHFWSVSILQAMLDSSSDHTKIASHAIPLQGQSDVHTSLSYTLTEEAQKDGQVEIDAEEIARGVVKELATGATFSTWEINADDSDPSKLSISTGTDVMLGESFNVIHHKYKLIGGSIVRRGPQGDLSPITSIKLQDILGLRFRLRIDASQMWKISGTCYCVLNALN